MTARDYRDDVIAELAASEAALRDQVLLLVERAVNAEADRDAFRLVAVQCLHENHAQHLRCERMDGQLERLREETRALRASLMNEGASRAA